MRSPFPISDAMAYGLIEQPHIISPYSRCSLIGNSGGQLTTAAPASAVYPTSNLAIYIPFRLDRPRLIAALFSHNGATASGNIDVGVYAEDGTKLVSAGSTAQAGTNTFQTFDVTNTHIGTGLFYLAIAMNNTTGTLFRGTANNINMFKWLGCAEQTSAFALPGTATFATFATSNYLPTFGLIFDTTLV